MRAATKQRGQGRCAHSDALEPRAATVHLLFLRVSSCSSCLSRTRLGAPSCLNCFLRGVAATARQATSTHCRSANKHEQDTKTDTSGLLPVWLAGLRRKRVRWEGVHCLMNIDTNLSSTSFLKLAV